MGYKTFLTFPAQRLLDGRINLILTKKKALSVKGAEICHSVEEALVRIDELKQEKHLTGCRCRHHRRRVGLPAVPSVLRHSADHLD